jgi:hypothetical protein
MTLGASIILEKPAQEALALTEFLDTDLLNPQKNSIVLPQFNTKASRYYLPDLMTSPHPHVSNGEREENTDNPQTIPLSPLATQPEAQPPPPEQPDEIQSPISSTQCECARGGVEGAQTSQAQVPISPARPSRHHMVWRMDHAGGTPHRAHQEVAQAVEMGLDGMGRDWSD